MSAAAVELFRLGYFDMAFRNFRFAHLHAARDAGITGLSTNNAVDSDFPLDLLIDNRASVPMKFSATTTGHEIIIDRGSGTLAEIDRLVVPAGHNWSLEILIHSDDNSAFSSPSLLVSVTTATIIDETFTANNERYIRVQFVGSGRWETPELIFTSIVEPSEGPALAGVTDEVITNAAQFPKPDGSMPSIQYGPQQRRFEIAYARATGSDMTGLDGLVEATGSMNPFFVDPPSYSTPPETDEPVRWMKMESDPVVRQSTFVPQEGTGYKDYQFAFRDYID